MRADPNDTPVSIPETVDLVRGRLSAPALTPEEMRGVESVGQRLRAELGRLYQWLPADARSVRTMAAFLGVDRNTCQRVVSAVQPATSGCETVLRLPGLKSVRLFVRRAQTKGAPRDLVNAVIAALDHLTTLVDELGESQARLKSRVTATVDAGAPRSDRSEVDVRRSLHEDMAHLIGRRLRAYSLVTAIGPHPDDPSKVEQAWMRGLIGLESRADAAPFALGAASTDRQHGEPLPTFNPLSRQTSPGQRADGLVEELSSKPPPTVTTRGRPGWLVTVLDPLRDSSRAADAVMASRISHVEHPARRPPEVFHTSVVMHSPATRLVFDVYLHRSLARVSVPSTGAFQYTMSFSDDPEQNWPFRLPGLFRLQLLGSGLAGCASDAWERHADSTAYLFEHTRWRADDYIGHRLDVLYPMWGATFYQWFDFRDRAGESPSEHASRHPSD